MPQLQGDRLTLLYDTNELAQLWQDDALLATNQTTASDTNVILSAVHPYGTWDSTNNVLIPGTYANQTTTNVYQRTNTTYCLMYAFEPDWGWLQKRQQQLDAYRQQGYPDTSRQVISETLEIMGLGWMLQTACADRLASGQLNVLPEYIHRLGRMAQEGGKGYYVDVYMQESGAFPNSGVDTNSLNNENAAFDLISYFWSALEHGIIEQLQSSNLLAASTVKMLEIANTNHQAVFLANSANWSTVQGSLTGYNLSYLAGFINQGYYLLLPQSGTSTVAGNGTWKGYGIAARLQNANGEQMGMLIGGGYHGGYVDLSGATINPPYVNQSGDSQPFSFTTASPFTFYTTAGDPVDMANGTFQIENTDLSLGQAEPKGITLSRYYNGTRRFSNPSGMADGWIHNYCVTANNIAAPQASLGGTTPAQAASMFTATAAAIALYNGGQPDAKNWLTNDDFVNLTFDARNRLLNAGGVTNLYDAMNNRIGQFHGTNAVQYVVDPNWGLPQTLMSIKNGVTNYYVYGTGLLYQVTETANGETTLTYHYDYRGSTVALTDDSGAVKDRFEYSLYGTMTYRAGTDDTPFLFNGRYGVMTDPNGLLYMNARFYSPYICRFLNPDPSGFSGGLNFYAYANGNPVSYLDPFGLWSWTQTTGAMRMIGGGLEAFTGYTLAIGSAAFGAATSWTGVGLVAGAGGVVGGAAVGLHGIDEFQAGLRQAISGSQVDSLTSQGLQAAGMSRNAANLMDAGISVVGSLGAGFATAPLRVATLRATDAISTDGLSFSDILRYNEMGSKALNVDDFTALGENETSSLFKAPYINDWIDTTGNPLTTKWYQPWYQSGVKLILTGNTPYANIISGLGSALLQGAAYGITSSSTGK